MNWITKDRLERFRKQGYFVISDAFSPDEVEAAEALISAHARRHMEQLHVTGAQGISRPNEIQFTAHLARQDTAIFSFATQPKLVRLAETLLGARVRLYWDQSVYKHPETPREFPWHQDNGYTPIDPEQYLTCWIALTESTIENGCIWVMPGSHARGIRPHLESPIGKVGYSGTDPGQPVPLPKGGMAVFSSLLLHRSGPNRTREQVRKGYIVQFCDASAVLRATGQLLTDRPLLIAE